MSDQPELQPLLTHAREDHTCQRDMHACYFQNVENLPPEPAPAAHILSLPKASTMYDVFLSAKSQDYGYARKAAAFLRARGLKVFFSDQELPEIGNSDYSYAISKALEAARHMLVVTSRGEHADSAWVRNEWQTYLIEKLSGRKTGNLVTLLCSGLTVAELPLSLRQYEAQPVAELERLVSYLKV